MRSYATLRHACAKPNLKTRAHAAAVNFEAQFLNSMFSQMLTAIDGDEPFGGGPAVRRMALVPERAMHFKSFAKAGGIGIADKVYHHALLAQQEAHAG